MKKISQREARELRKRVARLEQEESQRVHCWASDWPGGVHIGDVELSDVSAAKVSTARKLGHAVVAVTNGGSKIGLFACKL